jgi:hypothetical protein
VKGLVVFRGGDEEGSGKEQLVMHGGSLLESGDRFVLGLGFVVR